MKNKNNIILGLLICIPIFISFFYLRPNLNSVETSIERSNEQVKSIYSTNKALKNDTFTTNIYYPELMEMDYLEFRNICNFFNLNTNFVETENFYKFENPKSNVYFYFKNGLLQYKNVNRENKYKELSQNELIDLSQKYLDECMLPLNYVKCRISKENDNYRIMFINSLDGIDNYSFNNNILIDKYGNVLELNYYFVEFKKIDRKKTISMKECFYNLPTDIKSNMTFKISDIELVYIYENSIIQTAYRFDTRDENDNFYEIYVKNTIY